MKPWDKIVLFGNYDGFGWSSFERNSMFVCLENGDRIEIPECLAMKASDFIEKDKLKLKDVIARIKKLDIGTQKVWLNEILNELGSDYGTLKYKAGYDQGKLEGEWAGRQLKDADKIRQELNKPVVPQIVADYIEYTKENEWDLLEAMKNVPYEDNADFRKWFYKDNNVETFARAWLDGYEVEREKRYLVKAKIDSIASYLNYDILKKEWFFHVSHNGLTVRTYHTHKELEDAGLEEVFDSPLFEVEEVTG